MNYMFPLSSEPLQARNTYFKFLTFVEQLSRSVVNLSKAPTSAALTHSLTTAADPTLGLPNGFPLISNDAVSGCFLIFACFPMSEVSVIIFSKVTTLDTYHHCRFSIDQRLLLDSNCHTRIHDGRRWHDFPRGLFLFLFWFHDGDWFEIHQSLDFDWCARM